MPRLYYIIERPLLKQFDKYFDAQKFNRFPKWLGYYVFKIY